MRLNNICEVLLMFDVNRYLACTNEISMLSFGKSKVVEAVEESN